MLSGSLSAGTADAKSYTLIGEVMAQGIYGQFIYINPSLGVVLAVNSADRGFEDPGVYEGDIAMLRKIAAALSPSM